MRVLGLAASQCTILCDLGMSKTGHLYPLLASAGASPTDIMHTHADQNLPLSVRLEALQPAAKTRPVMEMMNEAATCSGVSAVSLNLDSGSNSAMDAGPVRG